MPSAGLQAAQAAPLAVCGHAAILTSARRRHPAMCEAVFPAMHLAIFPVMLLQA